jgi:hypothetical protein
MTHECFRATDEMHAYVEGGLDPLRSSHIESHLSDCADCRALRRRLEEERVWIIESLVKAPALSPRLRGRVMARIQETRRQSRTVRLRDRVFRLAGAAAAAAVLILAAIEVPRISRSVGMVPGVARLPTALPSLSPEAVDFGVALEMRRSVDTVVDVRPVAYLPEDSASFADGASTLLARFPDVMNFAAKLNGNYPRDLPQRDPCRPDPNRDGRLDLNDVAYSYQVFFTGAAPNVFEPNETATADPECEDICLRA